MAWQYHKHIRIIPGIQLSLSDNTLHISVEAKDRQQFRPASEDALPSGYDGSTQRGSGINTLNMGRQLPAVASESNIFSADVHAITSQGMQGIKEAIVMAHLQQKELKNDLIKIQASNAKSKFKLMAGYVLLYGLVFRSVPSRIKADIAAQLKAEAALREQISHCQVRLDIDFGSRAGEAYKHILSAFKNLLTSHKIWDVTAAHYQDRVAARSSASTVVNKVEVKFAVRSLEEIVSGTEALYFQNANGADLYLYPAFVVMYSSKTSFAVIGLDELDIHCTRVRFTETGPVPGDTKIIDQTWYKVNKNGSPDRRFKGNYQIPVVQYGQINLCTATGLNEEYECSNYEYAVQFAQALREYLNLFKRLKKS